LTREPAFGLLIVLMVGRALFAVVCVATVVGCGGAKGSEPKAPDPPVKENASTEAEAGAKQEAETSEPAKRTELPADCAKKDDKLCTPPAEFVNSLCQGNYPGVALAMFKKGTPWTRGYLTRKTKAWNASGGASESDFLEFDEEVLVLRHRSADLGGMQVSGAGGGYDALRWNGGCVTLAQEELTLSSPPRPKAARVEWRLIDDAMREKMRDDEKLNKAYRDRQKECKGATMGEVSDKCVKVDNALSEAIVSFVRSGGEIGKPERLP
jgi:hypothetical protein